MSEDARPLELAVYKFAIEGKAFKQLQGVAVIARGLDNARLKALSFVDGQVGVGDLRLLMVEDYALHTHVVEERKMVIEEKIASVKMDVTGNTNATVRYENMTSQEIPVHRR